jgi:hypothetical protein
VLAHAWLHGSTSSTQLPPAAGALGVKVVAATGRTTAIVSTQAAAMAASHDRRSPDPL